MGWILVTIELFDPVTAGSKFGLCPNCGGLTSDAGPKISYVSYPDDLQKIEALLRGELNRREHYCGGYFYIRTTVAVIWTTRRHIARFAPPGAVLPHVPENFIVELADDLYGLRMIVQGWIDVATTNYLRTRGQADGRSQKLGAGARQVDAIVLLGLAVRVESRSRRSEPPTEGIDELDHTARWLRFLTVEKICQLIIEAATATEAPSDVVDLCRSKIPHTALSDELLADLVQIVQESSPRALDPEVHGSAIDLIMLLMACGIAHLLVGAINPCAKDLANLLTIAWRTLGRDGFEQIVEDVALNPHVAPKLLTLENLIDACTELYLGGAGSKRNADMQSMLEQTRGLMSLLGYEEAYEDYANRLFLRMMTARADLDVDHLARDTIDFVLSEPSASSAPHPEHAIGAGLARSVYMVCSSIQDVDPVSLIEQYLAEFWRRRSPPSLEISFVCHCLQWLNVELRAYRLAARLAAAILPRLRRYALSIPRSLATFAWTELGNCCRYTGKRQLSLAFYALAERFTDEPRDRRTLRLNIGIVQREMGHLTEARESFDKLVAEDSTEVDVLPSFAELCYELEDFAGAIEFVTRALDSGYLRGVQVINALIARARYGRHGIMSQRQLLNDLRLAWLWARHFDESVRDLVAFVTLQVLLPAAPDDEAENLRHETISYLLTDRANFETTNEGFQRQLVLCAYQCHQAGDPENSRRLFDVVRLAGRLRSTDLHPLEITVAMARLCQQNSLTAAALKWVQSALRVAERGTGTDVPGARTSWTSTDGALIDDLAELAPTVVRAANDLLRTFELINSRFTPEDSPDAVPSLNEKMSALGGGEMIDYVAFLKGRDCVLVLVLNSGSTTGQVIRLAVEPGELAAAQRELAAMNRVNPRFPERSNARMANWWRLATRISDHLEPFLRPGSDVIFAPGRVLPGAPFQILGWPADPLIARHTVSMTPNLTTLTSLWERPPVAGEEFSIVTVPKSDDRPEFRQELDDALSTILAQVSPPVRSIYGEGGSKSAIVDAFATATEIALLCHGVASVGRGQGPGICVSADGILPPAALPVDLDKTLRPFVLTWEDLVSSSTVARVVVSIACSSGRVVTGVGGSTLGFERAILRAGGVAVVSPAWNADQASSLEWVRSFYRNHSPRDIHDVASAHRAAILSTMEKYDHPYHWGAFNLTRRLTGVPDERTRRGKLDDQSADAR